MKINDIRISPRLATILVFLFAGAMLVWKNFWNVNSFLMIDYYGWPLVYYQGTDQPDDLTVSVYAAAADLLSAGAMIVGVLAATAWRRFVDSRRERWIFAFSILLALAAFGYGNQVERYESVTTDCGTRCFGWPLAIWTRPDRFSEFNDWDGPNLFAAVFNSIALFSTLGLGLLLVHGIRRAKHASLRFHLGTIVAVVLLAGTLMMVNSKKYVLDAWAIGTRGQFTHTYGKGWPIRFHEWRFGSDEFSNTLLALNGSACLVILLAAGIGIEWLLYRRHASTNTTLSSTTTGNVLSRQRSS